MAARIPSAHLVARAQLRDHKLLFHKIGRDGSAKCAACFIVPAGDTTLGVLTPVLVITLNWVWGFTTALTIKLAK
jgi:gamma-glutamylcyclotransferase